MIKYFIILFSCIILLFNTCVYAKEELSSYEKYQIYNNYNQIYDPYEKFNRKIFKLNTALDKIIFIPFAKTYKALTTEATRKDVTNTLNNIYEPVTTVNYALQGRFNKMMQSFWRFIVNSTFGFGGMFDMASAAKLNVEKQTLGSTLAYYGFKQGPYLVLPIIGPTTMRDSGNTILMNAMNPLAYYVNNDVKLSVSAIYAISFRTSVLPFTEFVEKRSLDPYITVRDYFYTNNASQNKVK
ncbi:MAG: VacJ family lipoprotein [Rickettsiaceae bacterium]